MGFLCSLFYPCLFTFISHTCPPWSAKKGHAINPTNTKQMTILPSNPRHRQQLSTTTEYLFILFYFVRCKIIFFSFPVSYYLWLNIHILEFYLLGNGMGRLESKDWGWHCIEVYLCISGLIIFLLLALINVLQKFASPWVNFHTSYFENESFWNRVFHLGQP